MTDGALKTNGNRISARITSFQNEPLDTNEEYMMKQHDHDHIERLTEENKKLLEHLSALYKEIAATTDYDGLVAALRKNKSLLETIFAQDNSSSRANDMFSEIEWEQLFGLSRSQIESIINSEL